MSRTWHTSALLTAALVIGAGACSDDDDEAEEGTSLCDARDDLQASVDAAADVDVVADGTDALRTALSEVRTSFDAVVEAAGDEHGPEIDAVRSAVDDLDSAVEAAGDEPAADTGAALSAAATAVGSAMTALSDSLDPDCS